MQQEQFDYIKNLTGHFFNVLPDLLLLSYRQGNYIDDAKTMLVNFLHEHLYIPQNHIKVFFGLKHHTTILHRVKLHRKKLANSDYSETFANYIKYMNANVPASYADLPSGADRQGNDTLVDKLVQENQVLKRENAELQKELEKYKEKYRLEKAIFS